jgi:hypothetical protein
MQGKHPKQPTALCGAEGKTGPCKNIAGKKTSHKGVGRCWLHGGASPQAEVSGVVALARNEMQVMGKPLDVPPHEAILLLIQIASGEVAYCSEKIAGLEDHQAMRDTMFGPVLNEWIKARHEAMDRLAVYSEKALKANVEERHVRVMERWGDDLAEFARGLLEDFGLSGDPRAPEIVRRRMMLLASVDGTARDAA